MAPNNLTPNQPTPLSDKEIARVQKFPCNGQAVFNVGRKRGLTYSQAYDAIFEAEKCKVGHIPNDPHHRTFTQSGLDRIRELNNYYWKRAKDFIEDTWRVQKAEMAEVMAQMQLSKAALEQFEAWGKELAELVALPPAASDEERMSRMDREQVLHEQLEASPYMRDSEGKIARKPHAPAEVPEHAGAT